MSSIAIRIDKDFYNETKPVAESQFRSIPNQILYWAKIGRTAIDNPDLPGDFIEGIFEALAETPIPFEFDQKHEKHNNHSRTSL
jgi:hypothetical protein